MVLSTAPALTAQGEGPDILGELPGPRMRLLSCRIERRPSAVSRVTVEFGAAGTASDDPISCQREGSACPVGDLRLASLATLDAVTRATSGALKIELIGAKPIRAFDTNVVVVAAYVHHAGEVTKVIGAAVADHDLLLATSRATLAAVNRLASPLLAGAPGTEARNAP
ncbi:MAG TPA: hypothetical protein VE869_18315 [Gemmatimonas sp.]|nr:hypothetical protein [Gemmatimonas sp.]